MILRFILKGKAMFKKSLITLVAFLLVGVAVFGASRLISAEVSLPQAIADDTPCPAVGCASGSCHSFDNVPEPDGIHEMDCPEATCSSVDCHAYEVLTTRYYSPSDSSLNLWILAPVVLVVGLILIVRKL